MFSGNHSCRRRPPPPATAAAAVSGDFSGEPQKCSPHSDLLDPPHHSPPRAATTSKTTPHPHLPTLSLPHRHHHLTITILSTPLGCVWFYVHKEPKDVIKVENITESKDETVPASVHEVGESSASPFLREDSDGLLPERPNEAIDVPIEDEKSPSSEPRRARHANAGNDARGSKPVRGQVIALVWNAKVATMGLETVNQMPWTEIKQLMTAEFCPIEELQIMEHKLWNLKAEAIATACFTQNRSIIHRRFNKTPYELINGRKPDMSFLHVFCALCYPKNDRFIDADHPSLVYKLKKALYGLKKAPRA
nr:retrovirus-related Pol polyprotein from transposon TNT 1-94 [Tanacetum cinerariifolium]